MWVRKMYLPGGKLYSQATYYKSRHNQLHFQFLTEELHNKLLLFKKTTDYIPTNGISKCVRKVICVLLSCGIILWDNLITENENIKPNYKGSRGSRLDHEMAEE